MARAKKKESALTPEEKLAQALVPVEEQPYPVPENWCWIRFGTVCRFENGFAFKSEKFDDNVGVPVVRISNIKDGVVLLNDCIRTTEEHIDEKFVVHQGDLLIAMSGATTGKNGVYCSTETAYLNQRVGNIKIKYPCTLLPEYRNFYIEDKSDEIFRNAYGGAQPNISSNKICEMLFPIAPYAEQQRIVNRIEYLFAKLDEAKEKAQSVLDSFETRKAAILHKAFTGELTAKWRAEYGVAEESWRAVPLKNCGSWYGGGTPSTAHPEYWENGTLLWITSKDMKNDLIEDTLMHTTTLGVENSSAKYIEEPAVLFVMRSGILRRTFPVCMVKKPFTVNQDLKAVVPHDIELEYLFWAAKAAEKDILEKCMKSGTTVESINASALQNFTIQVASNEEQKEIVRILGGIFDKEQQAKEAAEAVLEKIDLLKKSILARAFRGELGTNDPTEESAVELLKVIIC